MKHVDVLRILAFSSHLASQSLGFKGTEYPIFGNSFSM